MSTQWEQVGNGFVLKAGAALLQAWRNDRGGWHACVSVYADKLVPGAYSRCAYKQFDGIDNEAEAKRTAIDAAKNLIAVIIDGLKEAETFIGKVS